ncbi:MAG: hypothetical protein GEU91_24350 [Rhizobiales bacterium]|nr:hypothetical protein [Hyphomicrobiales bacterium]
MTTWLKFGVIAAGALAAALACSPASAEILAATTTEAAFISTSMTDVAIPVRQNGVKVLKFTTTGPGKTLVKITYNAECVVLAPRGTYLSIRIEVDGVPTDPLAAGGDFAFCSAIDNAGATWMAVSRQSLSKVSRGEHLVRVFGRLNGPGTWAVDDSSLVVER